MGDSLYTYVSVHFKAVFDIADMMGKRELFHTEERRRVLTPYTPSLVQPLALRHHKETEEQPSMSLVHRDHPNSHLSPAFSPPSQSVPLLFNRKSNKVPVFHPFLVVTVAAPSPLPTQGHTPWSQQMNLIIPYLEVFKTASIPRWRKIEEGLKNSSKLSRGLACWTVLKSV